MMSPVVALMLSKTVEDDHRRELQRRSFRFIEPELGAPERPRRTWSIPFPRFGTAGSKA